MQFDKVNISTGEKDYWGKDITLTFYKDEHPHRGMQFYKYDGRYEMSDGRYYTEYSSEKAWNRAIARAKKQF